MGFSVIDGHRHCVCSLEDIHFPSKCKSCSGFKSKSRKNREIKFRLLMMAHSLRLASDPGPHTPSSARYSGLPVSTVPHQPPPHPLGREPQRMAPRIPERGTLDHLKEKLVPGSQGHHRDPLLLRPCIPERVPLRLPRSPDTEDPSAKASGTYKSRSTLLSSCLQYPH